MPIRFADIDWANTGRYWLANAGVPACEGAPHEETPDKRAPVALAGDA
jgi:hypothetical protein